MGYQAPQLYPDSNPLDLLPNVTFGGIPNTANITLTNIPYEVRYPTVTITDNITKTAGPHILKAGIFSEPPVYQRHRIHRPRERQFRQ